MKHEQLNSTKSAFRKSCRESLRARHNAVATALSSRIAKTVLAMQEYADAEIVAAYAAMPEEVQTLSILQDALRQGKKVLLPCVESASEQMVFRRVRDLGRDLQPSPPFGIVQPVSERCEQVALEQASLILVPGLAFDRRCRRLGRGKGYYDRALSQIKPDHLTVGLAFQHQVFKDIPIASNDVPLRRVITEKNTYCHHSITVTCNCPDETEQFGFALGSCLPSDKTLSLTAPLGSGKTVLVKGMLRARGGTVPATSPTYTLVNLYETQQQPFRHIDLFRWNSDRATDENVEELLDILSEPGLKAIEWADRAEEHIPMDAPVIHLIEGKDQRRVWLLETFLLQDAIWLKRSVDLISHKGMVSGI